MMASSAQIKTLERRLVTIISIVVLLVMLAAFAGVLLAHGNTLAIVDPLVRWFRPSASATDILRTHDMARKFGHFVIPAVAFAVLVIGPFPRRPLIALGWCALFATIDEFLQTFTPGRSGSILDVMLDTSGALFAYFVYRAIVSLVSRASYSSVNTP
jgi:hypothetical protein